MANNHNIDLPDIFPLKEIIVKEEEHNYRVFEGDNGTPLPQTEYTLDKAPIKEIKSVSGTLNGKEVDFEKGVDYELSQDYEQILWLDGGESPDPGSTFYVTYRAEPIMGRYIASHADELDKVEEDLENIIDSKLINRAKGEELDKIGDMFGQLGNRRGRNDVEYRIYLRSIVQSFISRGTKEDIKTALAVATEIPIEDIKINEDFEKSQYEVNILAATPITGSLIEQVSEIADPSGVEQARTTLKINPDEVTSNDSLAINPNKFLSEETAFVNDAHTINPRTTTVPDTVGFGEKTVIEFPNGKWENNNDAPTTTWNFFEWG